MLTNYITDPYSLTIDDLVHLEKTTKRYPSFTLGHVLLAKAVRDSAPELANDAIKKAAIYAINRNALRKYLENEGYGSKIAEAKFRENDVVIEEEVAREGREVELIQGIAHPAHLSKQEEQLVIIEKFIQAEPRITPIKTIGANDEIDDLSADSTFLKERLVTEPYAKILIGQGNFEKAIEVYQELSLIKPEKKTYFAEKIEELNKKNLKS